MKKILACFLAVGMLSTLVSGCKCMGKSSASKSECEAAVPAVKAEVTTPKEAPAAAVPMDHPAH